MEGAANLNLLSYFLHLGTEERDRCSLHGCIEPRLKYAPPCVEVAQNSDLTGEVVLALAEPCVLSPSMEAAFHKLDLGGHYEAIVENQHQPVSEHILLPLLEAIEFCGPIKLGKYRAKFCLLSIDLCKAMLPSTEHALSRLRMLELDVIPDDAL